QQVTASGNFDAAFLDQDLLLVNGLGLGTAEGAGVYGLKADGSVVEVINELGSASGFLARGETILYAGYYDLDAGTNKLYAFTLTEVRAALDAGVALNASAGDLAYEGDAVDVAASRNDLIVIDASFTEFRAVRSVSATVSGESVTMQPPAALVTAEAMADASTPTGLSADGALIALRLGSGDDTEIALITAR
ncbi:MAG: hypothetical protein JRH20_24160, partial [Deltaproteobacteria bacterium]|nr:hypothetical protein [Deltaproteobacteria bacterium]